MTYPVSSLDNGAEYSFKLRAVNGAGDRTATAWVTATPVAATPAGVTISTSDLTVAEGATGTYTVKLNTEPSGTVTVTPSSNDTGAATVSPASLTFNSGNYNVAQTVTVTGESDSDARIENVTVSHAVAGADYASVTAASVTVTVTDDDNPAAPVLTSATSTTNRVINLTWTHAGTGAGDLVKGAATFSNWRLEYRRKGGGWGASGSLGNSVATRNAASPRLNYPDGTVVEVRVRATGYVGGRPTHGPVSNVREVTFKNDDKAALTFTTGNYNTAQTVTVTGVEAGQATIAHAFRLSGATADMIPDAGTVSVTVTAGPPAKPANFAATPGNGQVTLNWSDPDDATITGYQYQQKTTGNFGTSWTAMSGSGAATTSHTVGSLNNGTQYTFRIRALSAAGNGAVSDEKSATPVATVPAGVTLSTPTLTVDEGGSATYTMRLNTQPSDTVTVTVTVGGASGDVTVDPASLTFTTTNYADPQTVTVGAARDEDTATDADVTLTHGATGGGYGSVTIAAVVVSVTDTTPTLQLLTDPQAVTEGSAIALIVTSDRAVPGTLAVSLTLADRGSSGFAAADIAGGLGPRAFNAAFNGAMTGTVTIATSRDSDTSEGAEKYRITLNDATGYAVGTDATADGTLNDGAAPVTTPTGGGGNVTARDTAPTFGDGSAADLNLTSGAAMAPVTLPAASGGNGTLTYTLTSVPAGLAGLAFDPVTRRLSGTPAAAGNWTFTWRADDADDNRRDEDAAILTFTVITARDTAPTFGDASVPTLTLAVDTAMTMVTLPAASGGNGVLTYTLTSAPAGLASLAFEAGTRRLSGTPVAAGNWTFTYRAHDADGNRRDEDAAILTFTVSVKDARARQVKRTVTRTLAAVASRTLSGALDNIGARLAQAPMSGLTLAGERVPLGMSGAAANLATKRSCASGAAWRHASATTHCGGSTSRSVTAHEMLKASAFSLGIGAEAGFDPRAPRWVVWGRGDYGAFEGRPQGMRYEGKLRTGWLGIDARAGAWVAGLAVSHATGDADYGFTGDVSGQGRLETEVTAIWPYGRWTLSEGVELRAMLGAGWGEARHRLGRRGRRDWRPHHAHGIAGPAPRATPASRHRPCRAGGGQRGAHADRRGGATCPRAHGRQLATARRDGGRAALCAG